MAPFPKSIWILGLSLLLPGAASANLKVADTAANLGSTVAEKTPKAVVEIVGNSNGAGTPLPSFLVKPSGVDAPLLTVREGSATANVAVGGSMQVGNSALLCDANAAGALRFDAAEGGLRVCDGAYWIGTTPPGTVIASAAEACPAGWLLSDGSAHAQAQYPALFAALGSLYDPEATAPDGHFLIPDYRGYFLRGTDGSGEVDPETGRTLGSIQADDAGPHTHALSIINTLVRNPENGFTTKRRGNLMTTSSASTSNPETATGHPRLETRPKNVAVHYCIKY